ncbi:hypothetical protein A7P95_07510 [Eikenella longinqua]|uniref:Uncharacterized protein n=2 Tax=Neisseriaceae TaxID=481 RepID=A0A1A9RVY8_9NEIS|nr:hypothetical protein A7P95_07510 [Eikenella longinqua]
MRAYVENLIKKSKVKKREYNSGWGMYLDFEALSEPSDNKMPNKNNIPILFSADFEFEQLDDAAFFMLYLTEDRKSLNFLEISTCFDHFNEEIMALTVLKHLLSNKQSASKAKY